MNRIFRNITICTLAAAAVATVILGLKGSGNQRRDLRCRGIEVEVADSAVNKFLDGKEVVRIVDSDFGGYVNRYADSVHLQKIENVLRKKEFIRDCEATMDKNGIVHVKITQYPPVLRIRDAQGKICYMDERGKYFPVGRDWATGLKTADGAVRKDDRSWMSQLAAFAVVLASNRRLSAMVDDIHCTQGSEIRMTLEGRNEVFDLGTPTDVETKLYRVEKYLDDIAPTGREYGLVTVKYEKQIICKIWKEQTLSQ